MEFLFEINLNLMESSKCSSKVKNSTIKDEVIIFSSLGAFILYNFHVQDQESEEQEKKKLSKWVLSLRDGCQIMTLLLAS